MELRRSLLATRLLAWALVCPAFAHTHRAQAGLIQFKDLNADKTAFQRTYANQARALDAAEQAAR